MRSRLRLLSFAEDIRASISLGKQEPPYPHPGYKYSNPILLSKPIPILTFSILAPLRSEYLDSSLIKLILVASIAFDAYLVSSADTGSIKSILSCFLLNGEKILRNLSFLR